MSAPSPSSSSSSSLSGKADKVRLIGVGGVRKVSEAAFDFLHTEMVLYFAQQISKQDRSLPTEAQAKKLYSKLESLGFSVGQRLAERYTKDLHFLSEQLDVIKFVCKDFWLHLFEHPIDKLQTNHRGVYVLHDAHCSPLMHLAPLHGITQQQCEEQARIHLAFSVGIVRGALSNLGMTATVKADIVRLPTAHFTITDLDKVRKHQQQQQQLQHAAETTAQAAQQQPQKQSVTAS